MHVTHFSGVWSPLRKIHVAPRPHPTHGPQPCGFLLPMARSLAAALGPSSMPIADPLLGMLFHSSPMAGLFFTFSPTPPKAGVPVGLCSGSAFCQTAALPSCPFAFFTTVAQSIVFRRPVLACAQDLTAPRL